MRHLGVINERNDPEYVHPGLPKLSLTACTDVVEGDLGVVPVVPIQLSTLYKV